MFLILGQASHQENQDYNEVEWLDKSSLKKLQKYGEKVLLGKIKGLKHGVSGVAYIVGSNKILIEDFSYDGKGPDAFFLVGTKGSEQNVIKPIKFMVGTKGTLYLFVGACNLTCMMQGTPRPNGTVLPYPFDGKFYDYQDLNVPILKKFSSEDIVLTLPPSLRSEDINWLSVWCRKFPSDFGLVVV